MQLTPSLHTVAILESEIAKEKRALERDSIQLDRLRTNAQKEDRLRRQQAIKVGCAATVSLRNSANKLTAPQIPQV